MFVFFKIMSCSEF